MTISFAQEAKRISYASSSVLIDKAAALWSSLSNNPDHSESDIRAQIAAQLNVPTAVVVFWQTAHGWKVPEGVRIYAMNNGFMDEDDADENEDSLAVFYKTVIAGASRYVPEERASSAEMIIYKVVRGYFQDVAYLSPSNVPVNEVSEVLARFGFSLPTLALLYGMKVETLEQYLVIHHQISRESLHHNSVAANWGSSLRDPLLSKILYRTWAGLYAKGLPFKEIGRRYGLKEEIIATSAQDAGDQWPECDMEFLDLLKTWILGHLSGYRQARQQELVTQKPTVIPVGFNRPAQARAKEQVRRFQFEQVSIAFT